MPDALAILRRRRQGFLLTGLGVLFISPDALLVKITAVNEVVTLFWRGLFLGLALLLVGVLRYRGDWQRQVRRCGWAGVFCSLAFSLSMVGFVVGMKNAAAGNVLVILNTAPVIAAVMAWLIWKERLPARTWGVILACVSGAMLMAWNATGRGTLLGILMAVMAAFALAANLNVARYRQHADMSVMLFIGAFVLAGGAALAGGARWPGWPDIGYLALLCLVFLPVAATLIQIGPRYLPAAEVSLMLLLETLLGSFLVWLFLGEVPPPLSVVGGLIIFATLLANGLWEAWQLERRRAPASLQGQPDQAQGQQGQKPVEP